MRSPIQIDKAAAGGNFNILTDGLYYIRVTNPPFGSAFIGSYDLMACACRRAPGSAVSISGRVTTPTGLGLRNAIVSLIDPLGIRRTSTTSSFGIYSFDNVATGQTYTISVSSKRYRFAARIETINGALSNLDFVGLE